MNAIEIKNLTKRFGQKTAVDGLNMTVPDCAIYGFIGENGSGKSTTEKLICGLLMPSGGEIKLYGKDYRDEGVRSKVSCLIEQPGCFPNISVWGNLMLHAENLGIKRPQEEIRKVLTMVHMEGSASNKFKNCSLGMKQRIGIAMALLGDPKLLILDEPINGLDADGMRIMREILVDLAENGHTVVISSHILGELEKIATHYGIIKGGKMIKEMTSEQFNAECPEYISVRTKNQDVAERVLLKAFNRVERDEKGNIRVYGATHAEKVVEALFAEGIAVTELKTEKIGLEEYYINLMHGKEVK